MLNEEIHFMKIKVRIELELELKLGIRLVWDWFRIDFRVGLGLV